jgi:hypothetical protein
MPRSALGCRRSVGGGISHVSRRRTPVWRTPASAPRLAPATTPVFTVTPITTATNTADKPITVGQAPTAIAITPNGATAYAANSGKNGAMSDTVTPITTATNTGGKPIKVGLFPTFIAITPNGKTAYVTGPGLTINQVEETVTPITTATNAPGKPIKVGKGPDGIVITR